MRATLTPALCIKCEGEAIVSVYLRTQGVEVTLCKDCINRIKEGKR